MPLQDIIFTIGTWIFVIALIPTLRGNQKPEISTSLMTGIVLAVFALTYLSLHLWMSMASTFVTSGMWLTLSYQRYKQK